MMTEQWRPVLGMEGLYEVSDLGRVKSLRSGQIIALNKQPAGYMIIHFYNRGAHEARYVHRVVLETFVGPQPPGMETLHLNNTRDDNRLVNLRWGSKEENERHKEIHGTRLRGEDCPQAKLTPELVRAIRERTYTSRRELAEEFGCSPANIRSIQIRKSWAHV
jgi:hypothetical protein